MTTVRAWILAIVGCSTLLSPTLLPAAPLRLHFIDVGQGDCTLIECPNGKRILVDCGRLPAADPTEVHEYILEHLDSPPRVDVVVVSHPDADHYNAIAAVLDGVDVGRLIRVKGPTSEYNGSFGSWLADLPSNRVKQLANNYHDQTTHPNADLDCGEAEIFVLAAGVQATASPKNARSIVLKVTHGAFDVMITGDATTDTEERILEWYPPAWLEVEVLRIGHHGSSTTSTSDEWAGTLKARDAIASAGYQNSHGHPRKVVLERLEPFSDDVPAHKIRWATSQTTFQNVNSYGNSIYTTATNGTIVVESDPPYYSVAASK